MRERQYIRLGHYIDINIDEDSQHRWVWWYTIDGEDFTELRETPRASAAEALLEAELDANRKVDAMRRGDAEA